MIITTSDNVKLNVKKTGKGKVVLFVHEFGGDQRSWKPQVSYFSRRYECITFNARGYPPSDVPKSIDSYSQERAVEDIYDVMNELSIDKAHIVGLSMGGFAALHFGIKYPKKTISLTIAGSGYGAEKNHEDYNIIGYFGAYPNSIFYKNYPKNYNYKTIYHRLWIQLWLL